MDERDDLEVVLDAADAWAGEYGFVNPEEATRVMEAIKRLTLNNR